MRVVKLYNDKFFGFLNFVHNDQVVIGQARSKPSQFYRIRALCAFHTLTGQGT